MGALNAALTREANHTNQLASVAKRTEDAIYKLIAWPQSCSEVVQRKQSFLVKAGTKRLRGLSQSVEPKLAVSTDIV